jgi:hypothetical protein
LRRVWRRPPTGSDIDAIAHQVAVRFLDNIPEVNADPEFDAPLGRQTGVPFDHAVLNFNCAPHRIDDAAKLDERPRRRFA